MSSPLSKANNILLTLIILVNAYILVAPFLPEIIFWVKTQDHKESTKLQKQIHASSPEKHQPNQVTIPSMLLDQPLHEGSNTYAELEKGVWRWPASSTPDKGGNTVLIGHRFTYTTSQGVFYLLDKVKVGDEIGLRWNNKKYIYKVKDTRVVPATRTSILDQTAAPTLTLYTCTPLWWPKDRLVVTAALIQSPRVEGSI